MCKEQVVSKRNSGAILLCTAFPFVATALYDYFPPVSTASLFPFSKGDNIVILAKSVRGWLLALFGSKVGYVPEFFVEKLPGQEPAQCIQGDIKCNTKQQYFPPKDKLLKSDNKTVVFKRGSWKHDEALWWGFLKERFLELRAAEYTHDQRNLLLSLLGNPGFSKIFRDYYTYTRLKGRSNLSVWFFINNFQESREFNDGCFDQLAVAAAELINQPAIVSPTLARKFLQSLVFDRLKYQNFREWRIQNGFIDASEAAEQPETVRKNSKTGSLSK